MARACRARSWVESSFTSGVRNGFSAIAVVAVHLLEMCSVCVCVCVCVRVRVCVCVKSIMLLLVHICTRDSPDVERNAGNLCRTARSLSTYCQFICVLDQPATERGRTTRWHLLRVGYCRQCVCERDKFARMQLVEKWFSLVFVSPG